MTAKEKWIELGYTDEIEASEKRRDPDLRKERHLDKSELTNIDDCYSLAAIEADWNWYNYWPGVNEIGNLRTPEEVKFDIRKGKSAELLYALYHIDEIEVMPTIFALEPNPEYDMIFKNGDKYDVKSSRKAAVAHKEKFPNVKVAYLKDKSTMKFVVV